MSNQRKYYVVISDNENKADRIFYEIETKYKEYLIKNCSSKNGRFSEFSNGIIMRHVYPICCCGFRFDSLWIDRNVSDEYFKYVVLPQYTGREDDIIWI